MTMKVLGYAAQSNKARWRLSILSVATHGQMMW